MHKHVFSGCFRPDMGGMHGQIYSKQGTELLEIAGNKDNPTGDG